MFTVYSKGQSAEMRCSNAPVLQSLDVLCLAARLNSVARFDISYSFRQVCAESRTSWSAEGTLPTNGSNREAMTVQDVGDMCFGQCQASADGFLKDRPVLLNLMSYWR